MSGIESTTARLRKTFKYPSDDEGSQGSRDELDEEEQDHLLSTFTTQSILSNTTYTLLFTALPLTLTPLFLTHLLTSSTPPRHKLLSLLALTSLLASAFTMFFLTSVEIDATDARARLDARRRQVGRATFGGSSAGGEGGGSGLLELWRRFMDKLDDIRLDLDREGPLLRALPVLNGVMCLLLVVAGLGLRGRAGGGERGGAEGTWVWDWVYLLLPGVMMGMTTVARRSIMDEQRGIRELRGSRYGYKGA
ncbi:hypothetical protein LTR70_004138 [Exophiala xenobiotica]|uniref:Uncharacterized protein n=1 Tax=Lithohypha guttulata TaxID=1690604 RepID=A0ABR0KFZ7_9EURO|nr:hypothetical protein LTR24_003580 [Lithohypha guttulata]KAK5321583.1 hypothetical protein LTR70_004138 [Exophiala xenobiotica]